MIFPVHADIIGLIEGILISLKPFAKAHNIELSFHTDTKKLETLHSPESISPDLINLICRVITFTPQKYSVNVQIQKYTSEDQALEITIENSGVNLSLMGDIRAGLKNEVLVTGKEKGSIFRIKLPLHSEDIAQPSKAAPSSHRTLIKPWYSEIRKRLTTHFNDPSNLERAAIDRDNDKGIFLSKVNIIILRHLDQEGFNAEDLARLVALSRTQLFRKMKNLTQMPPGQYIRVLRLKKAKELLETGHLNVSEVAYSVGFISNSHFTRAFQQQFGINPSTIK